MDPARIRRIEASFGALAGRAPELVDRCCALLFARHPRLRAEFADDLPAAKEQFVASLSSAVKNLRRPQTLHQMLLDVGRRHAERRVLPEHYAAARDALLATLEQMSGPAWCAQAAADWSAAIDLAIAVMSEGQRTASVRR